MNTLRELVEAYDAAMAECLAARAVLDAASAKVNAVQAAHAKLAREHMLKSIMEPVSMASVVAEAAKR